MQQKQLQLPELQPVNLLENRNILPTQPLEHPLPSLPGHLVSRGPDPGVFCCSMNSIPATSSLLNKMKLPLAIHIHPFKDSKAKVIYMYTCTCSCIQSWRHTCTCTCTFLYTFTYI